MLARRPDGLFEFRIFIKHALEDTRVPLGYFPILPDLPECRDEEVDFGVHGLVDGRAVDEQEAGGDPEREGEWWAEVVEDVIVDDEAG